MLVATYTEQLSDGAQGRRVLVLGLTERNVDLWKSLQQGFLNAAANSVRNGTFDPTQPQPKKTTKP